MHERAALRAREDGPVDLPGQLGPTEDEATARAAQRLVGRRGDDVGVREGAGVEPGRHEPCDVGHVHEEQRVVGMGDAGHALEVDDARVGARAGHDEPRTDLGRLPLEGVVVDAPVGLPDAVGMDLEVAPAEVERDARGVRWPPCARLMPRMRSPCSRTER